MVQHDGRDEIEIVRSVTADQDRRIQRHGRVRVAPEIDVVLGFADRHVDRHDTARDLDRRGLAQGFDVVEHAVGRAVNQFQFRFLSQSLTYLQVWPGWSGNRLSPTPTTTLDAMTIAAASDVTNGPEDSRQIGRPFW